MHALYLLSPKFHCFKTVAKFTVRGLKEPPPPHTNTELYTVGRGKGRKRGTFFPDHKDYKNVSCTKI
jgi:hypothetical protein